MPYLVSEVRKMSYLWPPPFSFGRLLNINNVASISCLVQSSEIKPLIHCRSWQNTYRWLANKLQRQTNRTVSALPSRPANPTSPTRPAANPTSPTLPAVTRIPTRPAANPIRPAGTCPTRPAANPRQFQYPDRHERPAGNGSSCRRQIRHFSLSFFS